MTTHVDDFLYAHTETGKVTIENLLSKFVVGSSGEGASLIVCLGEMVSSNPCGINSSLYLRLLGLLC